MAPVQIFILTVSEDWSAQHNSAPSNTQLVWAVGLSDGDSGSVFHINRKKSTICSKKRKKKKKSIKKINRKSRFNLLQLYPFDLPRPTKKQVPFFYLIQPLKPPEVVPEMKVILADMAREKSITLL